MGGGNGQEIPWEGDEASFLKEIWIFDSQILEILERIRALKIDKWNAEQKTSSLEASERLLFSSLFRILIESWEIKEWENFENIWKVIERIKTLINDKKRKEEVQKERIEKLEEEKNTLIELQRKLTDWMTALLEIKFPGIEDISILINQFAANPEKLKQEIELLITKTKEWVNAELEERVRLLRLEIEEKERKILELEESVDEYRRAAYFDPLTWIWNRRLFNKRLWELISKWVKFSIAYIDLDKFKPINDTYWHDSWDIVLAEIWNKIKKEFWEENSFRIWWEEFVVVHELKEDTNGTSLQQLETKVKNFKNELTWNELEDISWKIWEILIKIINHLSEKLKRKVDSEILDNVKNLIKDLMEIFNTKSVEDIDRDDIILASDSDRDNMKPKNEIIAKLNNIKRLLDDLNDEVINEYINSINKIIWWTRMVLPNWKWEIVLSFSSWIAEFEQWKDDIKSLIEKADVWVYFSKKKRNTITVYSDEIKNNPVYNVLERVNKHLNNIKWFVDYLYIKRLENLKSEIEREELQNIKFRFESTLRKIVWKMNENQIADFERLIMMIQEIITYWDA